MSCVNGEGRCGIVLRPLVQRDTTWRGYQVVVMFSVGRMKAEGRCLGGHAPMSWSEFPLSRQRPAHSSHCLFKQEVTYGYFSFFTVSACDCVISRQAASETARSLLDATRIRGSLCGRGRGTTTAAGRKVAVSPIYLPMGSLWHIGGKCRVGKIRGGE